MACCYARNVVYKQGLHDVPNERIHPFDDADDQVLMIMITFCTYDKLSSVARGQRGLQGLDDDPHWRIHSLFSYADRAQR